MRSRTSHAAKSGVGEHTARESESAQRAQIKRPADSEYVDRAEATFRCGCDQWLGQPERVAGAVPMVTVPTRN
jgi:hypothetical protein